MIAEWVNLGGGEFGTAVVTMIASGAWLGMCAASRSDNPRKSAATKPKPEKPKQPVQERPADYTAPPTEGPTFSHRDRAFVGGVSAAIGFAVVFAIVGWGAGQAARAESMLPWIIGFPAFALLLLGLGANLIARWASDANYMVEKATPMPLALAKESDDVWLSGAIRCPNPVMAPTFGTLCGYFHFVEHESVMERDEHGKAQKKWKKVNDYEMHARVWVEDEGEKIEIDMRKARFDFLPRIERETAHSKFQLDYLPIEGPMGVCGVLECVGTEIPKAPEKTDATEGDCPRSEPLPESPALMRRILRHALAPVGHVPGLATLLANEIHSLDGGTNFYHGIFFDSDLFSPDVAVEEPEPKKIYKLKAMGNVPLMVTPISRFEWVDRTKANETQFSVGGATCLFLSAAGLAWFFATLGQIIDPADIIAGVGIAVLGIVAYLPFAYISAYNRIRTHWQRARNAWAQIDVDLKMRRDLVPILEFVVKVLKLQEQNVFHEIARLRTEKSASIEIHLARERRIDEILKRFRGVVENNPNLKALKGFERLMQNLVAVEEKIAHGRHFYNEVVRDYNTYIERFPTNIVAGTMSAGAMPYFSQ